MGELYRNSPTVLSPSRGTYLLCLVKLTCYISLDLQTPPQIRKPAKQERLAQLNQSLNRLQVDCEEMLEMVLSVCDSEHQLTKRAVGVCRQLRRMRGDLDRSVSQAAIHRIK